MPILELGNAARHATVERPDAGPAVRTVSLAIAGPTGKVGRALLRVLEERQPWLASEHLSIRVVGAINTQRMLWNDEGLIPSEVVPTLRESVRAEWDAFAGHARAYRGAPLVFVDCTASARVAREYLRFLQEEVAVVTPNKIANTLDFPYYQALRRYGRNPKRRYLYETTVGAATPMLLTLEELRRTGDRIHRIEGVLSGTLSFVFDRINNGERFSEAVREAARRGFTEPNPATDLSGEDVARKLLILVREAGYRLERDEIRVEGLVPPTLSSLNDQEEVLNRLETFDTEWKERAERATAEGLALTYLARFDGSHATVGLVAVPKESPFVRLRPSENAVNYYSDRHEALPLLIQGIGAGPDVTARGVLSDVIATALEIAA